MKSSALILLLIEVVFASFHHHRPHYHPHYNPDKYKHPDNFKEIFTIHQWKYIDYLWNSEQQKQTYIRNGDYKPENISPIDVDKARDGRVFITTIRDDGVPASLSTVTNFWGPSGQLLKPYPNWSWHQKGNCDGITNVYRVTIDECENLYVLDTGRIGDDYVCPAQVLIFNLRTDTLVRRIRIPDNIANNKSGAGALVTPVIETQGHNCQLKKMFLADVNGYGLVVWSKDQFYRLESKILEPEPEHTNVTIAGESFELADSIIGLAHAPNVYPDGGGELYLRPFSSRSLYTSNTNSLTNGKLSYKGRRNVLPSQASTLAVSSEGILFYGLTKEVAIGCWNREKKLSPENMDIAITDAERLQFASGLKVIPKSRGLGREQVWAFTNRFQKIMTGSINFTEINFRVVTGYVDDLIRGTKCMK